MNGDGEILFLFQFTTAVLDSFFHGTFPSSKGEPSTQPLQTLIIFMTPSCTQNIAHMNTKITTNPVIWSTLLNKHFVKRMNNPTIIDQKLWKGFIPTFGCVQEAVYYLANVEKFIRCHVERLPNIIWRQSVNFFIQFGFIPTDCKLECLFGNGRPHVQNWKIAFYQHFKQLECLPPT